MTFRSDDPKWTCLCFRCLHITRLLLILGVKNHCQLMAMIVCVLAMPAFRGAKQSIQGESITDYQSTHTFGQGLSDAWITALLVTLIIVQSVVVIGIILAWRTERRQYLWPIIVKEVLISIAALGFVIAGVVWALSGSMYEQEEGAGIAAKYFYPLMAAAIALLFAGIFQSVVLFTYHKAFSYYGEKRAALDDRQALNTKQAQERLLQQPAYNAEHLPDIDDDEVVDLCKKEIV